MMPSFLCCEPVTSFLNFDMIILLVTHQKEEHSSDFTWAKKAEVPGHFVVPQRLFSHFEITGLDAHMRTSTRKTSNFDNED